jgi:hypothetical protein
MHRGGIQESMETMKECHNDNPECLEYLKSYEVDLSSITCEWYCEKDIKAGWEPVYIISGRYTHHKTNAVYPVAFSDYIVVKPESKEEQKNSVKEINNYLKTNFGEGFELY